jgi:ABC-type sugar transport system ATPase subunit
MASPESPLLHVAEVSKRFGGQLALNHASLTVNRSSIHALAGENGAGKSTLIKILAGVHQADEGSIFWSGSEVEIKTPRDARALGFAFLHQQLNLVASMDVRENLLLTGSYPTARLGSVDWNEVDRVAEKALGLVGLEVDPSQPVRELSPAQQQLVAFARVLLQEPQLLILDEPTASLGAADTAHMLSLIRQQRDRGATVVFVSHRIDELLELCDSITVLRDGAVVGTAATATLSREALVHMLGGAAEHHEHLATPEKKTGTPRLELEQARTDGLDYETPLQVYEGEVFGIAGLVGSGRTTLLNLIAGGIPLTGGALRIDGEDVTFRDRRDALRRRIVLVPEDRGAGLVPDFGVPENITMGHIEMYSHHGAIIDLSSEKRSAAAWVQELEIRKGKSDDRIRFLSGGNQQKVMLARALDLQPQILLLDEPTAGIDIATKEYLYGMIRRLADEGLTIVMVSSDLDELPLVCDRIAIFKRGRVTVELPGTTARATIVQHLFARDSVTEVAAADV